MSSELREKRDKFDPLWLNSFIAIPLQRLKLNMCENRLLCSLEMASSPWVAVTIYIVVTLFTRYLYITIPQKKTSIECIYNCKNFRNVFPLSFPLMPHTGPNYLTLTGVYALRILLFRSTLPSTTTYLVQISDNPLSSPTSVHQDPSFVSQF